MCEDYELLVNKTNEVLSKAAENINDINILEYLKWLRNACARGAKYQNYLASNEAFQKFLHELLFNKEEGPLMLLAWQILANSVVQNPLAQNYIWQFHGQRLCAECAKLPLGRLTDIKLMCLYNFYQCNNKLLTAQMALEILINVWQAIVAEKCEEKIEFLHLFFEIFLVHEGNTTVSCYEKLHLNQRLVFLDYVRNYIRQDNPNGFVHELFLQYLNNEFNQKSGNILRNFNNSNLEETQEIVTILGIIATASGCLSYTSIYGRNASLFVNVSSLLRAIIAVGKQSTPNMFTPKSKLEEIIPNARENCEFEHEPSYELKTLLMRSIANLLYKNKNNQSLCLDTQLLPALLESTNLDARNPMLKEWSILALRNACDGCSIVQEIIANLTNQGEAPNDLLKELNLQMGSLRIQTDKQQ